MMIHKVVCCCSFTLSSPLSRLTAGGGPEVKSGPEVKCGPKRASDQVKMAGKYILRQLQSGQFSGAHNDIMVCGVLHSFTVIVAFALFTPI